MKSKKKVTSCESVGSEDFVGGGEKWRCGVRKKVNGSPAILYVPTAFYL